MTRKNVVTLMFGFLAGLLCLLAWQGPAGAQRQGPRPPFANAVEQRAETIRLLREIRDLLREQNALLKSGKLHVVAEPKR